METNTLLNEFTVFIISHGRSDRVFTLPCLRRCGYTGSVYLIVDNEDKTVDSYRERFGTDNVIVFDKKAAARTTDNGDNFQNYRSTTHARNACYDIARKLGYQYFMVLDDDYNAFSWRFDQNLFYVHHKIHSLDRVLSVMLKFFITSGCDTIAMAQGGDYLGGELSNFVKTIRSKRKAMNSFICSVDRPIKFISRLNEDVNTYLTYGKIGRIYLTINQVSLNQLQTQTNPGGMSEAYIEAGTYVKSFYSVMYSPSSVKIGMIGITNRRIHHRIDWKKTVPMIVSESLRKS